MALKGSFHLKKVIANRGFYTIVELEVERIPFHQVVVDADRFPEWKTAVTFAAEYMQRVQHRNVALK